MPPTVSCCNATGIASNWSNHMADPHNGHGRVLLPNVPGFLVTQCWVDYEHVHATGHCICRMPSAINQDFAVIGWLVPTFYSWNAPCMAIWRATIQGPRCTRAISMGIYNGWLTAQHQRPSSWWCAGLMFPRSACLGWHSAESEARHDRVGS